MLGCDARCQDAMRDARMRCAMLHSILASHPGIAHRILASRIAHRVRITSSINKCRLLRAKIRNQTVHNITKCKNWLKV